MSLMFLCKLHNAKFSIGSYCEKWKPNDVIIKHSGSGWSTSRKCENCYYMPDFEIMLRQR